MKVLFSGKYDQNYNRTLVIKNGLLANDVEVVEYPRIQRSRLETSKIIDISSSCHYVFLPSFTHYDVVWAKRTFPNKKIIFDPLISKYLTKVYDYKTIFKWSPRALKNWWKDKRAMHAADIVLADTLAHKAYFHSTFNISLKKIKVLYIGVDTEIFFPIKNLSNSSNHSNLSNSYNLFTVGFYGSFAPLQGIKKIVEAADILKNNKDIRFEIVGGGFVEKAIKSLVKKLNISNITFTPTIPFDLLNEKINSWDICLGIFGDSLKSDIVIPNKIYHYAACRKPIITKESDAINEIFSPGVNIYCCKNNTESLVNSILHVAENKNKKRELIAQKGYELITKNYNHKRIGEHFLEIIKEGNL